MTGASSSKRCNLAQRPLIHTHAAIADPDVQAHVRAQINFGFFTRSAVARLNATSVSNQDHLKIVTDHPAWNAD